MDSHWNGIVLLGGPGSGKGTQAVQLASTLNIPHISTGDLFRENVKQVRLTFASAPPGVPDIAGVLQVFRTGTDLRVTCVHYDAKLEQALNALSPLSLEICPVSLEDALISYLGDPGEKTIILAETEMKP